VCEGLATRAVVQVVGDCSLDALHLRKNTEKFVARTSSITLMDEIHKSKPTQNYKRKFGRVVTNQRSNATAHIAGFGGGFLVKPSWYSVSTVSTPLKVIAFGLASTR